jgi:hypothetical protein
MGADNAIWYATIILNGLFLIFLSARFWKATAGRRAFWTLHLVVSFEFFASFWAISFIFDIVLMPLAYAIGARPYPYAWMNTLAFSALLGLLLFIAVEYLFLWCIANRLLRRVRSRKLRPETPEMKSEREKILWFILVFFVPICIFLNLLHYWVKSPAMTILELLLAVCMGALVFVRMRRFHAKYSINAHPTDASAPVPQNNR